MRIADLADDSGIVAEADKLAQEILAEDSNLSSAKNAGLRKNVERLFGSAAQYGWN